jgi:hypothetical protein
MPSPSTRVPEVMLRPLSAQHGDEGKHDHQPEPRRTDDGDQPLTGAPVMPHDDHLRVVPAIRRSFTLADGAAPGQRRRSRRPLTAAT